MSNKLELMKAEDGFLGLPEEDAVSYDKAKVVVIPFGLEASVSYGSGTAAGPAAMIAASHEVELFDEYLWTEPYKDIGIVTMQEPKIQKTHESALKQLEDLVEGVLVDGKFPLIFGGEHSITAGSIRPFAKRYKDLAILHFDAHADLRDGFDGQHYSHASAMRRCLDHQNVSLVSIGIRNISAEEIPFLEENKHRIDIYWAKDKANWDLDKIIAQLKDRPVYLSFDVDGFDASLMPATGTPEPGGIFWDEAINIIKAAAAECNIVGADINELAPIEGMHASNFVAAKLAYKIVSLVFNEKNIG